MEQWHQTSGCQVSQGMHSGHWKAVTGSEGSCINIKHFKTCPCWHACVTAYKLYSTKKAAGMPFNPTDDFTSGLTVEIPHMDIAIISPFQLCTK